MSKLSMRVCLLALMVLPTACVGPAPAPTDAPSTPAWVSGPDQNYPDTRYLLARARADTANEAQDQARATVARPFVLRVEAAGLGDTAAPGDTTRRLVALSDRIIEHIRVAERWQDPKTRLHHVLAVLPREVASASLGEEIARRDHDIRRAVEQSGQPGDLLLRIRHLDRALQVQVEREALQNLRTTVDPRASAIATAWTAARLRAERDGLFAQVRLLPRAAAGSTPGLEAALSTALSRSGLHAGDNGQGDYLLAARLILEDDASGEGTIRQQGVLEVTLVERAGERVRASRRWLIRANAGDRAGATRRALDEAANLLARNLRHLLLEAGSH